MRRAVTLATLVPLFALALAGCSDSVAKGETPQTNPDGRAVVVETVHFAPRVKERTLVGSVRPRVESDLGFRVPGKVVERRVQQGERVVKGQVLARLDATDLTLQREQANAEVTAATQNLTTAEAQDKRTLELRRNGWTTDAVVDRQLAASSEARSRLDRARRALDLADNQLGYTTLLADADGIVTATMIEPGQVVAAGSPVVRLARAGDREAVVSVPETLVEQVRTGTASVSLWSNAQRSYPASLREFAAAADPATRTFQARFAIEGADDAVVIGMTATVTIKDRDTVRVARLPISALYSQGAGPALFVVETASGLVRLQPVTVAGYDGKDVLIGAGVNDGDNVVALGVHKLDPGQKVRVVETHK